jgi:UDP-N-acetylmuramate dehydrogenase
MSLLSDLTTLRLGGPARRIVEARDERAVIDAVAEADAAGEPLLVLAGGSNVVIADEGFPGTVVRMLTSGIEDRGGGVRHVQAGEPWDPFVERCVDDELAGVECLSGIPGSAGATPIQNVGAYGQEVSETITGVRVYDRRTQRVEDLAPADCGFSYRSSAFKRTPGRWVVLAVTYALDPQPESRPVRYAELARELGVELGATAQLRDVREAVLRLRRRKGMVIDPGDPDSVSAGSFFTNPILDAEEFARLERRVRDRLGPDARPPAFPEPDGRVKTSAAWLVERAGFARGHGSPGPIAVSSKHTLALTNRGGGSAAQLLALAREIAAGVRSEFGVELVPEPVLVGQAWAEAAEPPLRLRSHALEWREVEGEIVALDLGSSEYVSANATGAILWNELAQGTTRERLIAALTSRFDVDDETAARDADAFVTALRDHGLLE